MKQLKKTETGIQGNLNVITCPYMRMWGRPLTLTVQALQAIVGGLLRDQRVFHMDSEDWIERLQLQGAASYLVRCSTGIDGLIRMPCGVQCNLSSLRSAVGQRVVPRQ